MSLQLHKESPSLEDTLTRLLRLGRTLNGKALEPSFSHADLMNESLRALDAAARSEGSEWTLAAVRITGHPASFQLWESEHSQLIGKLARQPHRVRQSTAALSASFMLVHRRSLFDYFRRQNLSRAVRRSLIAHFHGERSYVKAMVHEYDNYLRSSASLLCLRHLGHNQFQHAAFGIPLTEYEWQYRQYFNLYCEWALTDATTHHQPELRSELAHVKAKVLEARQHLLAMPASLKR